MVQKPSAEQYALTHDDGQPLVGCVVGVFMACWLFVTVAIDLGILPDVFRQIRSTTLSQTTGIVHRSELLLDDSGPRERLAIAYTYEVADQVYEGTRHRYDFNSESDDKAVQKQLTVGSAVTVFYDPTDPSDAILAPGLRNSDVGLLALALPFNAGALLIVGFINQWRRKFNPTHRALVTPTDRGWAFRPQGRSGFLTFSGCLLVMSIPFPICLAGFGGFLTDRYPAVIGTLGLAGLTTAIVCGVWSKRRVAVAYDRFRGTVTVRPVFDAAVVIPVGDIVGIRVHQESYTDEGHERFRYPVVIRWGVPPRETRVPFAGTDPNPPTACAIADWLATALRVPRLDDLPADPSPKGPHGRL